MEIFTLLETLEDILERSKSVPFTEKAIVDKEEMLRALKNEISVCKKLEEEMVKCCEEVCERLGFE